MSEDQGSPMPIKLTHDKELNIWQRMTVVQKSVTTIQKNELVKMFENDKGYKAVTHDDVAAALHLPLAEAGVFMLPDIESFSTTSFEVTKPGYQNQPPKVQTWYRTDIKIIVKWVNIDKPEEFIQSTGAAFALDTSDKSFAKSYSLALKIVLLKVHLLESRDGEEQRPFDQDNHDQKPAQKQNQAANKTQGNQNKAKAPADPKPKIEPVVPVSAEQYILPKWGGSNAGKKLGEIDTPTLEKLRDHMKTQLTAKPKPKHVGEIATAYAHVKAVIVDRNPPPDDIPENLPPKGADVHPEDDSQLFPPDETETPPSIDEFMIPKGVLPALDDIAGIPLKQISEKELRAAQKILTDEMAKGPKSKISAGAGFELRNKITEFFNSFGG